MIVLVDIGNTRLKWATLANGRRSATQAVVHGQQPFASALDDAWSSLPNASAVFVSSVVDREREAALATLVRRRFELDANFVRTPAAALGVTVAYANPERFGVDRFLALAALHGERPRAQVLASVGTALTLDALGADGRHFGGLIAPSPELARRALTGATARLTDTHGALVDVATDTADAIYSGSVWSVVALIERFRRAMTAPLGRTPTLILTGGGADEIAPSLPRAQREDDLVLRGLARWAEANGASS